LERLERGERNRIPLVPFSWVYSTAERRNGEDGYGDLLELPRFGDAPMLIRDGPGARLLDDAVGFHKQNITLLLVYLGHSDGPADSGLRMCKPVRREA
jgi:hypothetical protein